MYNIVSKTYFSAIILYFQILLKKNNLIFSCVIEKNVFRIWIINIIRSDLFFVPGCGHISRCLYKLKTLASTDRQTEL